MGEYRTMDMVLEKYFHRCSRKAQKSETKSRGTTLPNTKVKVARMAFKKYSSCGKLR
jgi:hypothetical protein